MSGRINPDSPGARRLTGAYLAERDTVRVRVRPGHRLGDHVDVGPGPPEQIVRQPGESFEVPRRRLAQLLERGIVELG